MIEVKPDSIDIVQDHAIKSKKHKIFLAGSIEMGKAEDWQTAITKKLSSEDVIIYNPRRDSWESSTEQTIHNPYFANQVNWELDKLEESDTILVYIDPSTTSPITLLEIGRFATSGKLVICCPKGFYRRGNIEVLCEREYIPLYYNIDVAIDVVLSRIIHE